MGPTTLFAKIGEQEIVAPSTASTFVLRIREFARRLGSPRLAPRRQAVAECGASQGDIVRGLLGAPNRNLVHAAAELPGTRASGPPSGFLHVSDPSGEIGGGHAASHIRMRKSVALKAIESLGEPKPFGDVAADTKEGRANIFAPRDSTEVRVRPVADGERNDFADGETSFVGHSIGSGDG